MATQYTANYNLPYPLIFDPTPQWTQDQQDAIVTIDTLIKAREDELIAHAADPFAHSEPGLDVFVVDSGIVSSSQVTLTGLPISGTLRVMHNGLGQVEGALYDYTIASDVITFTGSVVLTSGDVILVEYQKVP